MCDLVTVLTPCYNGEKFIDQYMNALLKQTYKNIQLIIVNDGSKDNSYLLLNQWRDKIIAKGIRFQIVNKENGGQPSAINAGLKLVEGVFFTWPDIDDIMHPDYLEEKIKFLNMHPEYDMVISKSAIVDLKNPDKILGYTWANGIKGDLFLNLLKNINTWYEPGAFMVRMSSFDQYNSGRHIYDACGRYCGPQIQMIMPLFYLGNIGFLDRVLYDYCLHEAQDHKIQRDVDEHKKKWYEIEKMIVYNVKKLQLDNEEEALSLVSERITRSKTCAAFQFRDTEWFMEEFKHFNKDHINRKDRIRYLIMSNNFLCRCYFGLKKQFNNKGKTGY